MLPFKLVEREVSGEVLEISVEGELDLAVAKQLQEALQKADSDCTQVLIGLENCEFIDSTGIAVVVQAHRQFAEEGRRVVLFAPTSQVLRILSVTGLTGNGLVFESAAEALAASTPSPALNGHP
ncbi:MAG TPA: STAS domain-containing protein [Solirubrobacterales bacterium]|jgi:anti-anti-sigma factor|nr:STAS domain-containing protein [Solirubrobacterales bacterium]